MSASERDFNSFELGDNVYELASGLIPEVAERLKVQIGDEPSSEALVRLVGALGPGKVLRDNQGVTALNGEEMANYVNRSGVQLPLNRSLWTPMHIATPEKTKAIIQTGAMANWMDRAALVTPAAFADHTPVYLATGTRVTDTGTEITNANVAWFKEKAGSYPTESQYAEGVVQNTLRNRGFTVGLTPLETRDGDEIANLFFEQHPALLDQRLLVVRVANAGVQLALQMRKAARAINPYFDANPNDPQLFVITDSLPVSRSDEQDALPQQFQKAQPALRQVAVTAKLLDESSRG